MMTSMRIDSCLFIFTSLFASYWLFCLQASGAANNLTVGQVMKDYEFLESSNKGFRLRFFGSESSSSRYLGIQNMNLTYPGVASHKLHTQMVWVANRGDPLADTSGALSIRPDGKLVLTNRNGAFFTINSQQSTSVNSINVSLTLLNTGNLVLTERSRIVWQSFDYPSDTWLPGMKLGLFRSTEGQLPLQRILTSWVTTGEAPNLGDFTLGVDPKNTKQLVSWKRGVIYWRSGIWNGYNFGYFPKDSKIKFNYFSNDSQSYFTFTPSDNNSIQWFGIDSSGGIGIFGTYGQMDINYCVYVDGRSSYQGCVAPPNNSNKRKLVLLVGVAVALLVIVTLIFFACYQWRRKHHFRGNNGKNKDRTSQGTLGFYELRSEAIIIDKVSNVKKNHELPLFTLSSIEIATDFFSDANKIGQGGFGPVYKGKLVNGEEIAVKRLSRSSGQGLQEFENEVMLISRLQHRNLVRLLGCCTQGDERILIYEYMPNKSLDSFLFDVTRQALLNWEMRVQIIEGIAQGLQYLHKYSRLKIIHRDLKTSNILLDSDMKPKISDFGTARIFGDNEFLANTKRIVGTYGYMSPEYAMDGLFSVKSDVFSFGVMMLEIISGKKNTGFYQPDRALNLLGYAWNLWKEGRGLEIMDHALVETCSTSEFIRYIQVGFLCVQESAADRPTISDVVYMLGNEMISLPVPKQPAFSVIVGLHDANAPEIPKPCSVNNLTISELGGR